MGLVQKVVRILRCLWKWYPVALVVFLTIYAYTGSTRCFGRVLGTTIWSAFVVFLGFWLWREANRIREWRGCYGHLPPEKYAPVTRLWETISAVEAYNSTYTWRDYLPFGRRWQRMKRLPKPSLDDIEASFRECENAVGPTDYNIQTALNRLSTASIGDDDPLFQERLLQRYIKIVEHVRGGDSENLIPIFARLGWLYFQEKRWKESAEMLKRAIDLQIFHSTSSSKVNGRINDEKKLCYQRVRAIALALAEENDDAENALRSLIGVPEEDCGVPCSEPLGTQQLMGVLLGIYIKQGLKTIIQHKENTAGHDTLQYLHDATTLISKMPSSRAINLKLLGRFFIWAGKITDGETACRLANSAAESAKGCDETSVCLYCNGNHESFRECDVCAKGIQVNKRWLFCKSCVDVDLCGECYEGRGEGHDWEDVQKFPRQCLEHEFFDVSPDEKEERWTDEMWIADVCGRLKAELECGVALCKEDYEEGDAMLLSSTEVTIRE
ncbi:hypothetical protein GQ44DRAFT_728994 [Phaeosphaeriaceae sp. PMI808]|nr:hypothetical protein GQ44DRAFT_728994 [Phaeosphaeriaceae sp. PMI808]